MQPLHKKNKEIETLRALAILLVMFRHTHYVLPVSISQYPKVLQGTWSGVDLFFVISGYVITNSLKPGYELYKQGILSAGKILKSFYIKRFLRLLPVCYTVLALYILGCFYFNTHNSFAEGHANEALSEVPFVILYVYNFFVTYAPHNWLGWHWSLSIEEQFYILLPFLLFIIKNNKIRVWVFISLILLINLIIRPVYASNIDTEKLWPLFTTPSFLRFDLLFTGCALALINININPKHKNVFIILSLMSVVLLATVGGFISSPQIFSYPIILICSALLVYTAAAHKNILPVSKPLQWIGGRSYALYLLNIPVLHFCNECFFRLTGYNIKQATWGQGFLTLAISIALSFIFAEILYRTVERPFINLGKIYSDKIVQPVKR